MDFESETFVVPLRANGAATSNGAGIGRAGDPALTLGADRSAAVAFQSRVAADPLSTRGSTYTHEGATFRLRNCAGLPPRRLTPRECERLQGFPDGWTAIAYRGKPTADGPRYRAIGNSMAAPVMRWILHRVRATRFQ
jgi:DNA (cytosine-5)-methyltransferase 1